MARRITAFFLAFVWLLALCAHAQADVYLAVVNADTHVYADTGMTDGMGKLSEGAVVLAEANGKDGPVLIQFVYPYILREGYVLADALSPLEGDRLAEYQAQAADGMKVQDVYLIPCEFTPGAKAEAPAAENPSGSLVRIVSQPKNQKGRIGQTVTFELEAYGAESYCWQFHNGRIWKNCTLPGCQGPAMRVEVTERRLPYHYRCILTDANGRSIFSDEVGFE